MGNKGRDGNKWDRLRTLGIVMVRCSRMESILLSTLYTWKVVSFCMWRVVSIFITWLICIGNLRPPLVYTWVWCLRRITVYTKSTTFCSPFYRIKPSQCPVFSVCPACYCLYPISCATFLSLIIFKIIPHPMTLLIAFPLQVSYLILYCLLSLIYHHITYTLPSSHILSPCVHPTRCLDPLS
jgi:hypothetical protein